MHISSSILNNSHENQVKVETDGNAKVLAIPSKPSGKGSSVNGGELLFTALATCFCNDLYHEAAKTQKYGALSDDEALSLITLNPAKQLGIDSRVGSLEIGKEADVAIFKGHPLSTYTIPMITIVDGVVRFDREKDPDDMRIYIDPSLPLEATTAADTHTNDVENCLQNAEEAFNYMFDHN